MISIKNLQKTFKNNRTSWQLGPVDFEVTKNETIAIVGKSGSGKSTLLQIIGILLDFEHGSFNLFGQNIRQASESQLQKIRNQSIGFVFQSFYLFPEFTLLENVEIPLLIGGISQNQARKIALEALSEVELANRLNHLPSELSGGQCQRGAIARAIVSKPKLILADEPTGNLDLETGQMIIQLLKKIHLHHKTILILATHDQELAKICSRQIMIADGKIKSDIS